MVILSKFWRTFPCLTVKIFEASLSKDPFVSVLDEDFPQAARVKVRDLKRSKTKVFFIINSIYTNKRLTPLEFYGAGGSRTHVQTPANIFVYNHRLCLSFQQIDDTSTQAFYLRAYKSLFNQLGNGQT